MKYFHLSKVIIIIIIIISCLCSCSVLGSLFSPDLQEKREDSFFTTTGHQLLKIFTKQERLGYIYNQDNFGKKVWSGKKIVEHTGQKIRLTYTRNDFDKLKLVLGDKLTVGPGLENIHHIVLSLEDITKYELTDLQPLIEFMDQSNLSLLQKPFVISMIKVSKFGIEAYQKVIGEFGAEYRPYPFLKIKGGSGITSKNEEEQAGYNVFIGYKLYTGSDWIQDFSKMPKADVFITDPTPNKIIDRVRARVRGSIINYHKIPEKYKNKIQLYLMIRNEYKDYWILQSKARIDTQGHFEGIVKLGTLEEGDGHRYSIAAFVSYFKINRKINSKIPLLPFNKGKYIINVKRKDDF